jgi:hypothetical protein
MEEAFTYGLSTSLPEPVDRMTGAIVAVTLSFAPRSSKPQGARKLNSTVNNLASTIIRIDQQRQWFTCPNSHLHRCQSFLLSHSSLDALLRQQILCHIRFHCLLHENTRSYHENNVFDTFCFTQHVCLHGTTACTLELVLKSMHKPASKSQVTSSVL